ncbi:ITSN [Mytilus coruscus]|uniref:ITSN n=1 Tax=Mytilus coruscus TaxID=42192 RepID=A0A6J8A317_MYTCO|nr:ITSN [Mytilus coruscus]
MWVCDVCYCQNQERDEECTECKNDRDCKKDEGWKVVTAFDAFCHEGPTKQLFLKHGEVISVAKRNNSDWWCGFRNNEWGWFPKLHVVRTRKSHEISIKSNETQSAIKEADSSSTDENFVAIPAEDSEYEEFESVLDISIPRTSTPPPQDEEITSGASILALTFPDSVSQTLVTPGPSGIRTSSSSKMNSKPEKRKKTVDDIYEIQHKVFEKELIKQDKEIEKLNLQIELLNNLRRNSSLPGSPSVNQLLLNSLLHM